MTQPFVYFSTLDAGEIQWFQLPNDFVVNDNQVVLITLESSVGDSNAALVSDTVYLNSMPKDLKGLNARVTIKVLSIEKTDKGTALLSLESDRLALFVVLTTRAEGRFADNCFTLRPKQKKVRQQKHFLLSQVADTAEILLFCFSYLRLSNLYHLLQERRST